MMRAHSCGWRDKSGVEGASARIVPKQARKPLGLTLLEETLEVTREAFG